MSKNGYLTRSQRKKIRSLLFKQNPLCFHCGLKMSLRHSNNRENLATLEHIIPRRDGGDDEMDNLALVHKRCNV